MPKRDICTQMAVLSMMMMGPFSFVFTATRAGHTTMTTKD